MPYNQVGGKGKAGMLHSRKKAKKKLPSAAAYRKEKGKKNKRIPGSLGY